MECIGNLVRARSIGGSYMKVITAGILSEYDEQVLKKREIFKEEFEKFLYKLYSPETWERHGKKVAVNM